MFIETSKKYINIYVKEWWKSVDYMFYTVFSIQIMLPFGFCEFKDSKFEFSHFKFEFSNPTTIINGYLTKNSGVRKAHFFQIIQVIKGRIAITSAIILLCLLYK